MNFLFIAASDVDVIIGIIAVVVWIFSQLFGKKKGDSPPSEAATPESGGPLNPHDELRKFFEELEKSAKPQEKPPRPAAPPPLQQKPAREIPVRRGAPLARVTPPPAPQLESQAESSPWSVPEMPPPSRPPAFLKAQPTSSTPELRDPKALRKLIIATEILGKPMALRQG